MNNGGAKENVNPILHNVEIEELDKSTLLGWSEIEALNSIHDTSIKYYDNNIDLYDDNRNKWMNIIEEDRLRQKRKEKMRNNSNRVGTNNGGGNSGTSTGATGGTSSSSGGSRGSTYIQPPSLLELMPGMDNAVSSEDLGVIHALASITRKSNDNTALLQKCGIIIPDKLSSDNDDNNNKTTEKTTTKQTSFDGMTIMKKKRCNPNFVPIEAKQMHQERLKYFNKHNNNNNNNGYMYYPHHKKPSQYQKNQPQYQQRDPITSNEIYEIIRNIQDPEHPHTLEELGVVKEEQIEVNDDNNGSETGYPMIDVHFTPTIPHCSMATLIGLCIRVKLIRSLPRRFKVSVKIQPGSHASEDAVNKQLADKERVCAALENKNLLNVVNRCIKNGMT